jgi:hypothetical protein
LPRALTFHAFTIKEGTVLDFFKKGISREEKEAQDARLAAQGGQSAAEFKEKAVAAAIEKRRPGR